MTIPMTVLKRLTESESGCWEWTGYRDKLGYGQVRINWKCLYVHNVVYEAVVGPIPEGLELDHLCRNSSCANPFHLEPVTHRENLRRGNSVVGIHARKTHCIHGHEFTEENTYHPPKRPEGRYCRQCKRDKDKARYATQRREIK